MGDSRKGVTRDGRRRDASRVDPDLSNAIADTIARWLVQHAERSPRTGRVRFDARGNPLLRLLEG
jgi:hypothetical protein